MPVVRANKSGGDMGPDPGVIAIDFDGTYTRDPEMWDAIIGLWKGRGWRVFCVTARHDTPENVSEVRPPCSVIFCRGCPKEWFVRQERGLVVDIWVDDCPGAILYGVGGCSFVSSTFSGPPPSSPAESLPSGPSVGPPL